MGTNQWGQNLAELQLSAWVSAQSWTGSLQQGRTFSLLGRWSAVDSGCCTAGSCGVTVQGKGWGGKKGHDFSCAVANHNPSAPSRFLCQPLQGAEQFLQVFLL